MTYLRLRSSSYCWFAASCHVVDKFYCFGTTNKGEIENQIVGGCVCGMFWSMCKDHTTINPSVEDQSDEVRIAVRETRMIRCVRAVFLALLVASTAVIAATVHQQLRESEQDVFTERFNELADKIFGAMGKSLDDTLGDIDTFTFDIESFARYSNSTWPFVTLPEFALRAQKFLRLTDIFYLSVHHFVTEENRKEWENYTKYNNQWVSLLFRGALSSRSDRLMRLIS